MISYDLSFLNFSSFHTIEWLFLLVEVSRSWMSALRVNFLRDQFEKLLPHVQRKHSLPQCCLLSKFLAISYLVENSFSLF
jgi:hypothetical protein